LHPWSSSKWTIVVRTVGKSNCSLMHLLPLQNQVHCFESERERGRKQWETILNPFWSLRKSFVWYAAVFFPSHSFFFTFLLSFGVGVAMSSSSSLSLSLSLFLFELTLPFSPFCNFTKRRPRDSETETSFSSLVWTVRVRPRQRNGNVSKSEAEQRPMLLDRYHWGIDDQRRKEERERGRERATSSFLFAWLIIFELAHWHLDSFSIFRRALDH
jgi:hypothetical protein